MSDDKKIEVHTDKKGKDHINGGYDQTSELL